MSERISKDQYYLGIAESVGKRATCMRRKYGAVIVSKNDTIVSTGYNGAPREVPNCTDLEFCMRNYLGSKQGEDYGNLCLSVHAEMNAMLSASTEEMVGSTLYIVGWDVALEQYASPQPCMICHRMMINSGIARCVGLVEVKCIASNGDVSHKYEPGEIDITPESFEARANKMYREVVHEVGKEDDPQVVEYFKKRYETMDGIRARKVYHIG